MNTDTDDVSGELDTLIAERTSDARAEWLQRRPVAFAGAISGEDVAEILVLLAELGVPPTVRAIREVYGGGSPNVITPLLRNAWVRKDVPRRLASLEAGKALPPRLLQFWDLLLEDARTEATKALTGQKREIEDIRRGLDAQTDALMHRERLMDERVAGLQQVEAELRTTIQMAEASAAESRSSLVERTREVDTLKTALTQAAAASLTAEAAWNQALASHEAGAARLRETLAVRDGELSTSRMDAAAQARRADEFKALTEQARHDANSLSTRADRLVVERATLDIEIAALRTQTALDAQRMAAATRQAEQLEALRVAHAALQAAHERRGSDMVQHQHALAQARAEVTIKDHLESDLTRTKEELRSILRDRDHLARNPPMLLTRIEAIEALLRKIAGGPQENR